MRRRRSSASAPSATSRRWPDPSRRGTEALTPGATPPTDDAPAADHGRAKAAQAPRTKRERDRAPDSGAIRSPADREVNAPASRGAFREAPAVRRRRRDGPYAAVSAAPKRHATVKGCGAPQRLRASRRSQPPAQPRRKRLLRTGTKGDPADVRDSDGFRSRPGPEVNGAALSCGRVAPAASPAGHGGRPGGRPPGRR